MKRIINTASDTVLLVALVALFAIPVIVFGGFSPTTISSRLSAIPKEGPNVLGAKTATIGKSGEVYNIELIPSATDGVQVEEISRTSNKYLFQTFIPVSSDGERNETLLRVVNTSGQTQRVIISLSNYADLSHLKHIALQLDNTILEITSLAGEMPLEPSITLNPGEWLNIGFNISEKLPEPTTISLSAKLIEE